MSNTQAKKSESRVKDSDRKWGSLLLLLVLVPLLWAAGAHNYQSIWVDAIFVSFMALVVIYIMYELNNAIIGRERGAVFWTFFATSAIAFAWLYLSLALPYIANDRTLWTFISVKQYIFMAAMLMATLLFITAPINEKGSTTHINIIVGSLAVAFVGVLTLLLMDLSWEVVLILMGAVVLTDVMAYQGGKRYGKTKLTPEVSPNKTVEGLLIGYIAAFIGVLALYGIFIVGMDINGFYSSLNSWVILIAAAVAIIIAPAGDLTMSKIKREHGVKDFSNIIPGHGGVLDRFDSHILAVTTGGMIVLMFI